MSHLFHRSTCATIHMHIILNNYSTSARSAELAIIISYPISASRIIVKYYVHMGGSAGRTRSKRFRLVLEQRKTQERPGFLVLTARKMDFARSWTLVPRSLLRNRTETLALITGRWAYN